jgi:hypothetical protein
MARARNLKPSFFTNDILAEVPALGRLLFQGLWCVADREGRLADRPRKLKAEILPYDDCDVEAMLCMLAERGFIQRYQVNGERFIQVVNFTKHQNPHIKESASSIPAPDEHSASTVQAPEIPERAGLNPESLLLNPDSLLEDVPPVPAAPARAPKRATVLPADFAPDDTARTLAASLALDVTAELAKFRDYYAMTGKTGKDWQAGFRNWLTKAADFRGGRPQARASPMNAREESRRAAGISIFGNVEEQHGRIIDVTPAAAGALGGPDFP